MQRHPARRDNRQGGRMDTMRSYVDIVANKIRNTTTIDELIKVEAFSIDKEHKGYLYAYRTGRGVHIETCASVGTPDFESWTDMYCNHSLHEYLDAKAISDTAITLESRIERLLNKTIAQLDILTPIERDNVEKSITSI